MELCDDHGLGGGEASRTDTGGYYVQPTIFDGVEVGMTIAREEIFGPVLSVPGFTDIKEAIKQANANPVRLAGGRLDLRPEQGDPDVACLACRHRACEPV